jgi:hypothetical protein
MRMTGAWTGTHTHEKEKNHQVIISPFAKEKKLEQNCPVTETSFSNMQVYILIFFNVM